MEKKPPYWEVEIDEEDQKDLEPGLFGELNSAYGAEDEENGEYEDSADSRHSYSLGMFSRYGKIFAAILTLMVFGTLIAGQVTDLFHQPAPGLLAESAALRENPQVQRLHEAVVLVKNGQKSGTGFNVDHAGFVITNAHVVEDARAILVVFPKAGTYGAEIHAVFPEADLAFLKINEGKSLPVVPLGLSQGVEKGSPLLVIGNPLGIPGIAVSGTYLGTGKVANIETEVLLVQASIHKGSSGSPVFQEDGMVVGMIFATAVRQDRDEVIMGLAIPIEKILEKMEEKGK